MARPDQEPPASPPTSASDSTTAELATLRARIDELEAAIADKDLELNRYLLRATDAENEIELAKERIRRDALRDAKRKERELLGRLLDVIDNLDRALEAGSAEDALFEGVELVRKQFLALLASYGVEPMDVLGNPFAPAQHEAISAIAATRASERGTVVAVVQKGYLIGTDVLRPARVVVAQ